MGLREELLSLCQKAEFSTVVDFGLVDDKQKIVDKLLEHEFKIKSIEKIGTSLFKNFYRVNAKKQGVELQILFEIYNV